METIAPPRHGHKRAVVLPGQTRYHELEAILGEHEVEMRTAAELSRYLRDEVPASAVRIYNAAA